MTERKPASPAVEPLSDITWQRVERDLFAALDCDAAVTVTQVAPYRPRSWAPWALAGALAAAALLVVVLLDRTPPAPPQTSGLQGGSATPSRVVTQEAASEISFGEAAITVGAESALTLHGDADRGVLIVLERGSATFEVAPRAGRPPFVITAGEVSIRVVGTRFTVVRSGDAARVDVAEGRVEVVARGHRALVLAGDSWSSFDEREAVERATTDSSSVATAPPSPDGAPEPEPEIEPEIEIEDAPVATPSRPRAKAAPDDRARFERAAALEATDARAALRAYRALARRKGPWAANALYAAARLAAELGDRTAAAAMLRDYLGRFPKGANAGNARALLQSLAD